MTRRIPSAVAALVVLAGCGSSGGTSGTTTFAPRATTGSPSTGTSAGSLSTTSGGGSGSSATSSGGTPGTATGGTSGPASSTGTSVTATNGASAFVPFPHRVIPPLPDHGGPKMSGFTLVTITASNDALAADLQTFSDALSQSRWYQTVAAEYGLAAPTNVHVTGTASMTARQMSNTDVATYIEAVIDSGAAPVPDGNTIYLLYIPDAATLSGNVQGYHASFPSSATTLGDCFAAVQRNTPAYAETQTDQLTETASHEILESATDPVFSSLFIGPQSAQPWSTSVWASLQTEHVENGDLCEGTRTPEVFGDGGDFFYQRIFSDAVALDGGDNPCIPPLTPYFNVTVDQDWYSAQPGETVIIALTGWSAAQRGDWLLYPHLLPASSAEVVDAGLAELDVASDAGIGTAGQCLSRAAINNGVTGSLTVTMPAQAGPGDYAVLQIDSFEEGGNCETPLSDDGNHHWLVGVYVPECDAGPSALTPSPISCAKLGAAFAGGDLYQLCGYESGEGNLGQMERYSPASNTWSVAASPPQTTLSLQAALTGPDGRLYSVNGWNGSAYVASLTAFDPTAQRWETLPSPSTASADVATALGPDGRIYVFGGWNGTLVLDTAEAYDLDAGWSTLAPLPQAVDGAAAARGADGRIYVMGGERQQALSDGGDAYFIEDTVQIYDVDAGSWSIGPVLPIWRAYGVAVADDAGAILLFGGETGDQPITEVDRYTEAAGWDSRLAPIPNPEMYLAGALAPDGQIDLIGGEVEINGTQIPTGALQSYSEACDCWTQ